MKECFFSIAIPVYNRKQYVKDAIDSIVSQQFDDYELIIVDNNSSDGTWDYLCSLTHPRVKIFRNIVNIGMVPNWVKCIEYAKGTWFKFLMSDDILSEGCLLNQYLLIKENLLNSVFISRGVAIGDAYGSSHNLDFETIDINTFTNQIKKYIVNKYPLMPNAYTLKTQDLKTLISTDEFTQVVNYFGNTGHDVDFYIFCKIALQYDAIIQSNNVAYLVRAHKDQGSNRYNKKLKYLVRTDRFITNLLVHNSTLLGELYVFKHLFKYFIRLFRANPSIKNLSRLLYDLCAVIGYELYLICSRKNSFID